MAGKQKKRCRETFLDRRLPGFWGGEQAVPKKCWVLVEIDRSRLSPEALDVDPGSAPDNLLNRSRCPSGLEYMEAVSGV